MSELKARFFSKHSMKKYNTIDDSSCHTSLCSDSNHSHQELSEMECLKRLKNHFHTTSPRSISKSTIFRFASYYNFQYYVAMAALQGSHKNRRLHLRMDNELIKHFENKILFPLPGLKTKSKCDVLYMRPSRFNPSKMNTSDIIDNLCYVLNDLSQTEEQCLNGVALIANMKDWTPKKHFSYDYCHQFMRALQGKEVPTKVQLFLIVNPPSSFGHIWKIMKPMFSRSFAKKVKIIKEERLSEFLMDGCELYLPDEFSNGWKDTEELLEDLVDLKHFEDDQKLEMI